VPEADNHLIRETAPLSLIYEECAGLLATLLRLRPGRSSHPGLLAGFALLADAARAAERYYQPTPGRASSTQRSTRATSSSTASEGPFTSWTGDARWGDPSQDLAHFCSPLTTLWKTDFRMSLKDRERFLDAYRRGIRDRHLKDTLMDRIRLRSLSYICGDLVVRHGLGGLPRRFRRREKPRHLAKLRQYMNWNSSAPCSTRL